MYLRTVSGLTFLLLQLQLVRALNRKADADTSLYSRGRQLFDVPASATIFEHRNKGGRNFSYADHMAIIGWNDLERFKKVNTLKRIELICITGMYVR